MKFLVYTVEPLNNNTTLENFDPAIDKKIARMLNLLKEMNIDRVLENESISLFVENADLDKGIGIVSADIYKLTNPGKALHQLKKDGDKMAMEEIISENEDAFYQGILGMKKMDGEIVLIIESDFGSYFNYSCKGMDITPQYSSETIESIQESETIGNTTLDFADDFDLTASLFKPPEDGDIREEKGFGKTDLANKLTSLLEISKAHRISLDIERDLWLNNVEIFDELIETGIITTVRVEETIDGIVRLGEGGERAIRKDVTTSHNDKRAIEEAFANNPL